VNGSHDVREPDAAAALSSARADRRAPQPADSPPAIAFAIAARARIPELDRLVAWLVAADGPRPREIIVVIETQGAAAPSSELDAQGVRWVHVPPGRGIGYNRNRALDEVTAPVVFGVDDDCLPKEGWIEGLLGALEGGSADASVGSIEIPSAGYVGDSISALGFPAGGSAGYENMFRVDPDGTTYNIACGNCAIRTGVLREVGSFDESLSWGGEDTELAHRFVEHGKRIVFVKDATITHPPRTRIRQFVRWCWIRGRAKAQFARKVPVSGFVSRRLKSYWLILRRNAGDPKIALIAPLLATSIVVQQAGVVAEWLFPRRERRS
jgi:GT2 family glycosyltransferase